MANTSKNFNLGDGVVNLGIRAIVWNYHTLADGTPSGMLILRDANGMKWIADPDKCEPIRAGWQHADGFVIFA